MEVNSLVISEIISSPEIFHALLTQICQSKEVKPVRQGVPGCNYTGRTPQELNSQGSKPRRVPKRHVIGIPTRRVLPGSQGVVRLTQLCPKFCAESWG